MSEGVMKTAYDALICKKSALGDESCSQSPLLDRFYGIRAAVINNILFQTLRAMVSSSALANVQIVILGAGLDVSYATRIRQLYDTESFSSKNISVYEVDLPEIINARKLSSSNMHIGSSKGFVKTSLIACDLRDSLQLMTLLQYNGFDTRIPTIYLTECVLSYVETHHVNNLIETLSIATISVFISYDPMLAESSVNGFGIMLQEKFAQRGAPLLHAFESPEKYINFFQNCGWKFCLTSSLTSLLSKLKIPYDQIGGSNRLFDEYASLALLMRLYSITVASNDLGLKSLIEGVLPIAFDSIKVEINTIKSSADNMMFSGLLRERLTDIEVRLDALERRLSIDVR
jgi:O-methyltransferase involved in polyketide biosynthesis